MIRTERLLLREWREADRDDWAAMNADPAVMEFFPSTLDRAQADAAFDRISTALAARGWGQGFATEAARAVMAFAFDDLGLEELVSFTSVGNARSRAVMERVGMTHDAGDDFDHPNVPRGDPLRPHVLYRGFGKGLGRSSSAGSVPS